MFMCEGGIYIYVVSCITCLLEHACLHFMPLYMNECHRNKSTSYFIPKNKRNGCIFYYYINIIFSIKKFVGPLRISLHSNIITLMMKHFCFILISLNGYFQ